MFAFIILSYIDIIVAGGRRVLRFVYRVYKNEFNFSKIAEPSH